MAIEIKNADVIIRLVKEKLDRAVSRLGVAVSDEATRIVRRTRAGLDVDGNKFAPYTPAYNKFKGSHKSGFVTRTGKKGKNARQVKGAFSVPPQPVDLTLTGNMLNAIQSKVETTPTGAVATIYFNSSLEALKARENQNKRPFFGLSEDQVQRIKKTIES